MQAARSCRLPRPAVAQIFWAARVAVGLFWDESEYGGEDADGVGPDSNESVIGTRHVCTTASTEAVVGDPERGRKSGPGPAGPASGMPGPGAAAVGVVVLGALSAINTCPCPKRPAAAWCGSRAITVRPSEESADTATVDPSGHSRLAPATPSPPGG